MEFSYFAMARINYCLTIELGAEILGLSEDLNLKSTKRGENLAL